VILLYAKSKQGTLVFDNQKEARDYLLSVENKPLMVRIDRETGIRSFNQNSWYWGVVLKTISETYGHSAKELNEIYKRMFIPPKFIKYKGREIKLPQSTSDLSKNDFGEYIERIRAEVASDGIVIPDPIRKHLITNT